jgi:hypothetical protein
VAGAGRGHTALPLVKKIGPAGLIFFFFRETLVTLGTVDTFSNWAVFRHGPQQDPYQKCHRGVAECPVFLRSVWANKTWDVGGMPPPGLWDRAFSTMRLEPPAPPQRTLLAQVARYGGRLLRATTA